MHNIVSNHHRDTEVTERGLFLSVGEPFDRAHGPEFIEGVPDRQKASVWKKFSGPKAREVIENRYLPPARQKPLRRGEGPILHENTSLSVLRVSNEPLSSWGEWVVKIISNVNDFLLLVVSGGEGYAQG